MVFGGAMESVLLSVMDFARFCRGFRGKTAQIDEFEWSYMERDAARTPRHTANEPVVFIHGFSSGKESWTRLAAQIDSKHQIIVPDLPGQGRTLPADPTFSYTIDDQAERLHKFLERTVPTDRKVHLVGCSMGGLLAGIYSAKYPQRVRSLSMICPAGITMPNKSDAWRLLDDEGKNLLLAKTPDEMAEMFSYISYRPVPIPRFVISLLAGYRVQQIPVFEKILNDTLDNRTILEERLHLIQAKTFIFWGKNDRILDVSSLPILQEKLVNVPQQFSIVFDECGHTVQHEKYKEVAKAVNQFINDEIPSVDKLGH